MMDLERKFYRWYKKIDLDIEGIQAKKRWQGIQAAVERFQSYEEISELMRIYFRLPCDTNSREEFVECFAEIDKGFDEDREEELVVLAGSVLAQILEEDDDACIALSFLVLYPYYDAALEDLSDIALRKLHNLISQIRISNNNEEKKIKVLDKSTLSELCVEDGEGQFGENAPSVLVEIVEDLYSNIEILNENNQKLLDENKKCREEADILSWIIGEWSDILDCPLAKVQNINGACVLGVELADLIRIYPGPYSAKAFLQRMLSKCAVVKEKISLTELIDSQTQKVRKTIRDKYGEECETKNLPILSAISTSLDVDGVREWLPFYKKKWKIDPDSIEFSILEWTMLVYQECIVSSYYDLRE